MNFVAAQGVKHIFLLPGGGSMHLVDSLGRNTQLEYIPLLHEQACSIAAEAYARITNNLGVVLVTTGPGGTNAITGVAGGWLESTPMLILSGQVKRSDLKGESKVRQLGPQELDIVTVVKSITKYAVTVEDPKLIGYHLEKAIFLAKHGRPGPVWLDVPLDVQGSLIDTEDLIHFKETETEIEEGTSGYQVFDCVSRAIEILNNSRRPVVLVGQGIQRSGASEVFQKFIEVLGVPVLTTWMAAELLPDAHRLNFGKPGMIASRGANLSLQNADCVVAIGVRMDSTVIGFDHTDFARGAKKIVVDIDQHEIEKLKTDIEVAAVVDAKLFIQTFLEESSKLIPQDRLEWMVRCEEWKKKYPIVMPEYRAEKDFVNVYHFTEVLAEELRQDEIIIPGSSGAGLDAFWLAYKVKGQQRLFSTGGLGAMGFGIPAAIGGCIAGKKRVISVDGDGGFQLNIQELATVASRKLPIKFFILNNQGYASIRNMQMGRFSGNLVASDKTSGLMLPDVLSLATAYGLKTSRIVTHQGMREKIREILTGDEPVICDVLVNPNLQVVPRVVSELLPDGSMRSKPLEDLWPFLSREELAENMIIKSRVF
ncbi:thiamine pyrophosphate-binding protein [Desulfosporosinus fructosivorans]|uniref:Thiamine pyrophosphate-binding protein n=2 Tax=Desulfosporosinus fructosivorans TaxID=2018669 RepID=A0A4Z0QXA4_9FIRM|nr:thiamine pyrophosphate-binding protein [Desulfosporosinus fructosivorans]